MYATGAAQAVCQIDGAEHGGRQRVVPLARGKPGVPPRKLEKSQKYDQMTQNTK